MSPKERPHAAKVIGPRSRFEGDGALCATFFGEHEQQTEIARKLGLTQSRVSRLLKRALDEGFYSVRFNFPPLLQLAGSLANSFSLRDAVVVPTGELNQLKEDLGRATAQYFERVIANEASVGLSCGNTLLYFVKHLNEGTGKKIKIYPLTAETSLESTDISPNTLVGMMTAKFRPDAKGYSLPAQLVRNGSPERNRKSFLDNPEIKKIWDESQNVDIALTGIGAVDSRSPGFCEFASRNGISEKKLEKLGMVGEFNYQPIDESGNELVAPELESLRRRFIGVPLTQLRDLAQSRASLVIAVAGGPDKKRAIKAALARGLFNVLVTDQETAQFLLQ